MRKIFPPCRFCRKHKKAVLSVTSTPPEKSERNTEKHFHSLSPVLKKDREMDIIGAWCSRKTVVLSATSLITGTWKAPTFHVLPLFLCFCVHFTLRSLKKQGFFFVFSFFLTLALLFAENRGETGFSARRLPASLSQTIPESRSPREKSRTSGGGE